MIISGLQKLTLLDYPNKTACIIFTGGCNFKCSYCQNSDLIGKNPIMINEEEVFEYLKKRKKVLDGVVVTGGEPTIHKDLPAFIKKIKDLKLLVKLDTNGSNPIMLEELINNHLIDYIAMDIKNTYDDYKVVIKINTNLDNIKKSIELIKKSNIDHEFRTTIIKGMHTIEDLDKMIDLVDGDPYYLQNFRMEDTVKAKKMEGFTEEELKDIKEYFKGKSNVTVRYV